MNLLHIIIAAAVYTPTAEKPTDLKDLPAYEQAQELYRKGSDLFEAANYRGAIDYFTRALGLVRRLPGNNDDIRLTLLYNIASAHEKAYEMDQDVLHLHQALSLYQKYRDFANQIGDLGEQLDIEIKVARLKRQLAEVKAEKEASKHSEPKVPKRNRKFKSAPTASAPDKDWKPYRNLGIGLLVAGGGVMIGGIATASAGSKYDSRAQEEVDKLISLGIPPEHPAWDEGDEFIREETRKGKIVMGVGGTLVVVGVVGTGVGIYYLIRAKKARFAVSPSVTPNAAGFVIEGKF